MQPVMHRSRFVHHVQVLSPDFSRYLSHSIKISSHAQDQEHQHGTCAAGLPGICDVNLVSHTMGDDISPVVWSRGTFQPEKPTQGAPASAECPTPAEKSAHSDAHSTSESARWPRVLLESDPAAAAGTTVAARALPAPLAAPPRPTRGPMELPEKRLS